MSFFAIVTIAAVLLVGTSITQADQGCGIEASSNLVHQNPWLVLIEFFHDDRLSRSRCGGTLIDQNHVLTAAHCVTKPRFTRLEIRLGDYNLTERRECVDGVCTDRALELDVEQILVHPEYDGHEHDLAILRLKEPAPYTDFIRPVCLPTGKLDENAILVASGWGIIPRLGEYSDTKKIIPLPFVNRETCEAAYKATIIPKSAICAGGEPGIDTCNGDSGGPLVWFKARAELRGVVSAGNVHCGTQGTPGIYMNVIEDLDWINSAVS